MRRNFFRMLRLRLGSLAIAWAAIAICGASAAHAVTTDWNTNSSGNFSVASNWDNGVPDSTKIAAFSRGSVSYTVTYNGAPPGFPPPQYQCNQLIVSGTNSVTFVRNNLQSNAPSLTATNTDITDTNPGVIVGQNSLDAATLNTSFAVSCTAASIGFNSGATGTLNVNGGTFNVTGSTSSLVVGDHGHGALNVSNAAHVNVNFDCILGFQSINGGGVVAVNGAGSMLAVGDRLYVGFQDRFSNDVLNISSGGQVSSPIGYIGYGFAGDVASGAATVDGAGSTWTTSVLSVGSAGAGLLRITGGGQVNAAEGVIGDDPLSNLTIPGTGAVTVDGAGSKWTNTDYLEVGSGSLYISDGAQVSNSSRSDIAVTGLGIVTVDGAGSKWTCGGDLYIHGFGALNIIGGGSVSSAGIANVGDNQYVGGTATIDGSGSTWVATGGLNLGVNGGVATLTVRNGGLVSCGGPFSIGAKGTLNGDGTISGAVSNGGVVAPGSTVGALHVSGSYTQTAAGKLQIELSGTTPGTQFDRLTVTGAVTLGGTLQVSLTGGFTPTIGNSFDVLDWGTLSGTFSTLVLPTLAAPLAWDTSQLYTTGALAVSGPTVRGDFNRDGQLTAADIPAMLQALTDLNAYKSAHSLTDALLTTIGDFDSSSTVTNRDIEGLLDLVASQGGGSGTAVPEPASLGLLIIGAGTMIVRRRHE